MNDDEITVNACQVDWEGMGPEGRAAFAELLHAIAVRVRDGLIPGMGPPVEPTPTWPTRDEPVPYPFSPKLPTPGISLVRWWWPSKDEFPGKWEYAPRCTCGWARKRGYWSPKVAAEQGRTHWRVKHKATSP